MSWPRKFARDAKGAPRKFVRDAKGALESQRYMEEGRVKNGHIPTVEGTQRCPTASGRAKV